MFKYPLAVTIDTNIFDAAKFDLCDTSTLKILENYVKSGKIKVVLSDIVVRESKRHIADQVKKICGIMRKARAAALEGSTEHLINTIGLGEILGDFAAGLFNLTVNAVNFAHSHRLAAPFIQPLFIAVFHLRRIERLGRTAAACPRLAARKSGVRPACGA